MSRIWNIPHQSIKGFDSDYYLLQVRWSAQVFSTLDNHSKGKRNWWLLTLQFQAEPPKTQDCWAIDLTQCKPEKNDSYHQQRWRLSELIKSLVFAGCQQQADLKVVNMSKYGIMWTLFLFTPSFCCFVANPNPATNNRKHLLHMWPSSVHIMSDVWAFLKRHVLLLCSDKLRTTYVPTS